MQGYDEEFFAVFRQAEVTIDGSVFTVQDGVNKVVGMLDRWREEGRRVFFAGNGASATIAAHAATDLTKTLKMKGLFCGDSGLLTCISNDLGFEQVYAYPFNIMAEDGDALVAISSSGRSPNILQVAKTAKEKECPVITLSGFSPDNPLRTLGTVNFHVPSDRYGLVEVAHTLIIHWIVDMLAGDNG